MPFPVLGSNSAVAEFAIDNSLRFNDDDSAYLSKTFGSAGNQKTMTFSFWVKRSYIGSGFKTIYGCGTADGDEWIWSFRNDKLDLRWEMTNGTQGDLQTNQLFRDPSAWYHIVFAIDTTQGTSSNRFKWYVNGDQITSFATEQYPAQNTDNKINGTVAQEIGRFPRINATYDGYLSEFNFIDGQALAPTEFGETNDNGVWIPKEYEGTYGTNGFFLEFQNSGSLGTDTSGNTNDWTSNNLTATDQTTDTPTNNFCTMNPLANYYAAATYSEGNCKVVTDAVSASYATSTMGVANGKWYAEFKASAKSGGGDWFTVGIAEAEGTANNLTLGRDTGHTSSANNGQIGYLGYGTNFVYQNDAYYATSYSTDAYGVGDIIGVALNADDNEVTFYKNGTAQNSGTAFTIGDSPKGFWHFAVGDFENQNYTWECNFGNAPFTISSGNSDANGYGNFEYAPPANYYSLCSKNLAEYG